MLPSSNAGTAAPHQTTSASYAPYREPTGTNLVIIVFTNLGSEAGLICKPQLRPVTTTQCCEAVSPNPINTAFTYNGLPRFHTVDLSPQFRKGNFDAVCTGRLRRACGGVSGAMLKNERPGVWNTPGLWRRDRKYPISISQGSPAR
jgi:hypothetical protein